MAAVAAYAESGARGVVTARELPDSIRTSHRHPRLTPLEKAERAAVADALRSAGGNRTRAADGLGIGRATLYRKMRRYGLGRLAVAGQEVRDN